MGTGDFNNRLLPTNLAFAVLLGVHYFSLKYFGKMQRIRARKSVDAKRC